MSGIKSSVRFVFCLCPIICVAAERGSINVLCNPLLWEVIGGGSLEITHPPLAMCTSFFESITQIMRLLLPIDLRATTTSRRCSSRNWECFLGPTVFPGESPMYLGNSMPVKTQGRTKKSANENNIFPIWQPVWQLQIFAKRPLRTEEQPTINEGKDV